MSKTETTFRKAITRFGELPGILIPLLIIGGCSIPGLHQWISYDPYRQTAILGGNHPYQIESAFRPLWIGFGGVFLSYSIGTVIKYFYYKPRPIPRDTSTLWKRINAGSMPSIHASNGLITAIALVCAIFTLPINIDQYPRAMLAVYGCVVLGFFYYLSIALSRIALQKHYPIDVLAGSLLGTIITYIMRYTSHLVVSSNVLTYVILFFL